MKTILIVDDDRGVLTTLLQALADESSAVIGASSGYEAIGILADRHVDLLITDIRMPGLNGFELARQAKLMRPNLHVIYLSGYPTAPARGTGPIFGSVIPKPIRNRELLAIVEGQLGAARRNGQSC